MRKTGLFHLALAVAFLGFAAGIAYADEPGRLRKSTEILRELTGADDHAIPNYILERAEGIIVIPDFMKGGFIIGAEHGRGVMSVRDRATNTWSTPTFVQMTGGSFGAQIGLQSVDLVFVILDRSGVDRLLDNKFTLGGDLSVAAGPVGRSAKAATDIKLDAKILAYSRAKGLFAGATLSGAALKIDKDGNRDFYGKDVTPQTILFEKGAKPGEGSASALVSDWRNTLAQVTGTRTPAPTPTTGR